MFDNECIITLPPEPLGVVQRTRVHHSSGVDVHRLDQEVSLGVSNGDCLLRACDGVVDNDLAVREVDL